MDDESGESTEQWQRFNVIYYIQDAFCKKNMNENVHLQAVGYFRKRREWRTPCGLTIEQCMGCV